MAGELGSRRIGRFSTGQEQLPESEDHVRVGRFSTGQEQLPESEDHVRVGRFSTGQEHRGAPAVVRRLGVESHDRRAAA